MVKMRIKLDFSGLCGFMRGFCRVLPNPEMPQINANKKNSRCASTTSLENPSRGSQKIVGSLNFGVFYF